MSRDSTSTDPPLAQGPVVGAIPARYASSRLPGKALLPIAGRPMIEHVYRRVSQARGLARVVVLTDDERIANAVDGFGGEWEMTPRECPSGTDRIAYAARRWEARAVINVQGDEPLIDPDEVTSLVVHLQEHPEDPMVTLATRVSAATLDDPDAVKVVMDLQGYALYFSRAAIPHRRRPEAAPLWKHVGIYGYRRETLLRLAELEPTPLERSESLEQLRALEHGFKIRVLEATSDALGVDTEDDLARVRDLLERQADPSPRWARNS